MSSSDLPTLSGAQVKKVDALTEERFGIPTDWLMEAAGWQVARNISGSAAVVCGVGNNAGDGLAAARHLHRWGRLASVCCVDASRLRGTAQRELNSLARLGIEVADDLRLEDADLVVDAIFGTGLSRAPEGKFAQWIEAINLSGKQVVSVDLPSGLDADSGLAYAPFVRADVTITLGLPKPGLSTFGGRVLIVDIGIPFAAYAAVGVKVPPDLFAMGDRVTL
ncbi:MAG TPA: NAD(P)H-hydrate epimerase [Candidatus Dormibacteraeota bacterium]|nr:NAD(P)H-hydrate epimerase [Candidatus Dormibacteraeota bacterium]